MKNILLLLFLVTCSCSAEDGPPRECRVKVVIEVNSDADSRAYGVGEEGMPDSHLLKVWKGSLKPNREIPRLKYFVRISMPR